MKAMNGNQTDKLFCMELTESLWKKERCTELQKKHWETLSWKRRGIIEWKNAKMTKWRVSRPRRGPNMTWKVIANESTRNLHFNKEDAMQHVVANGLIMLLA